MSRTRTYNIGDKSGFLEIVSFQKQNNDEYKRERTYALCICHKCGRANYLILPYNFIKQKSCGCDRTWPTPPSRQNSKLYKGYKEISSKFIRKSSERAKKKKLKFDLTLKFLWNLFEKQDKKCALSGEPIHFGYNSKSTGATASLDRIDSNQGYTEDNVQWVHVNANYMKHKFTQKEFLDWCEKIVYHSQHIRQK